MTEIIIASALPILATVLLGFLAGRVGSFTQDDAAVLNRMVLNYALPLMLFVAVLTTPLSEFSRNLPVIVWIAVGMIGGLMLVFLLSHLVFRSSVQLAALRALAIAGPATPYAGAPVLTPFFPVDADIAIAVTSLYMNILQIPLALLFLVGTGNIPGAAPRGFLATVASNLVAAVTKPVVVAPLLAFVLLFTGFELPTMLRGSFDLLGLAAGGTALFAAGIVLFCQKVNLALPVIVNVIGKNLLVPGAVLLAMIFFALPPAERGLTTLALAVPTASISVIFAVEYKCGEAEMASTLFWSTIASIATLGLFISMTV